MNAESIISRATLEPVKVCRECQADTSCHECGTTFEAGGARRSSIGNNAAPGR